MPDFLPRKDSALLNWTSNLRTRLNDSYELYGIRAEQAVDYSAAWEDFEAKLSLSLHSGTRTPLAVFLKDQAREKLEAMTRVLARIIRANPSLTSELRILVGLGGREASGALIPAPTEAPRVSIDWVKGKTVKLRLRNSQLAGGRRRPSGTYGATIYSFIGETPPTSLSGFKTEFTTTSTEPQVTFRADLPIGTKVWLTAQWLSPRLEAGPASLPVEGYLQHGMAKMG